GLSSRRDRRGRRASGCARRPVGRGLLGARLIDHLLESLLDLADPVVDGGLLGPDRAGELIDDRARLLDPEVERLEPGVRAREDRDHYPVALEGLQLGMIEDRLARGRAAGAG